MSLCFFIYLVSTFSANMNITAKKRSGFILLAAIMLFLFNAPILTVANTIAFSCGIPVLYLYLFSTWIFCIILLMLITHFRNTESKKHE